MKRSRGRSLGAIGHLFSTHRWTRGISMLEFALYHRLPPVFRCVTEAPLRSINIKSFPLCTKCNLRFRCIFPAPLAVTQPVSPESYIFPICLATIIKVESIRMCFCPASVNLSQTPSSTGVLLVFATGEAIADADCQLGGQPMAQSLLNELKWRLWNINIEVIQAGWANQLAKLLLHAGNAKLLKV